MVSEKRWLEFPLQIVRIWFTEIKIFLHDEIDYSGNMESEFDTEPRKQQSLIVLRAVPIR